MQGLISGVPRGSLILLDLYAELFPQWQRYQRFYGAPFVWCMLHNFGGNLGEPACTCMAFDCGVCFEDSFLNSLLLHDTCMRLCPQTL